MSEQNRAEEFVAYLNQRLMRKNDNIDKANDRTRMLLKTERAELEFIKAKFMEIYAEMLRED